MSCCVFALLQYYIISFYLGMALLLDGVTCKMYDLCIVLGRFMCVSLIPPGREIHVKPFPVMRSILKHVVRH